jgi:hypothetical protein
VCKPLEASSFLLVGAGFKSLFTNVVEKANWNFDERRISRESDSCSRDKISGTKEKAVILVML